MLPHPPGRSLTHQAPDEGIEVGDFGEGIGQNRGRNSPPLHRRGRNHWLRVYTSGGTLIYWQRGALGIPIKEKGCRIGTAAALSTGRIRTDGCVTDHEGSLCALNVLFGGQYRRGGRWGWPDGRTWCCRWTESRRRKHIIGASTEHIGRDLPLVLVIRPCARGSGEIDNPCRRRWWMGHWYAGGGVHFRRRDEAIALIVVIWKWVLVTWL